MNETTYYQRTEMLYLIEQKIIIKVIKKKIKKENMEEIDIIICLRKKNKLKEYQKNYREAKKVSV